MNEPILQDAIHQAAADGNVDLIKEYLAKDPALVLQLHSTQGTIPLIHAIRENKLEAVECLLEAGSPLDFIDKENNSLLMHYTTNNSDREKKIKRLLAEHMAKKSSKLRWDLDLPYHISTQALIIILLNLILYHYEKRNFTAKNQLLVELTKQLNVLISPKLPLKDIVDIHFLASNICTQIKVTKEVIEYSQTVIHFCIKPLEQASDEERPPYLIILAKIYQQIVSLLQEDNNPFAALPIIRKTFNEHRKLYNLLKLLTPCSIATADALSTLNAAINQFNRHVNKLNELDKQRHATTLLILPHKLNSNTASKPGLTNVKITGKQLQQKSTTLNPSIPIKRKIETDNSNPSTTASNFFDNSAKAAGPEAKQSETKRVRFDLPSKSPSK